MESSYANALESKHAVIEDKLRQEMNRPAPDAATIQSLKKQKLHIKEMLATH